MKTRAEYAAIVEKRLVQLIPEQARGVFAPDRVPSLLSETMRYSLLAGGKRLRPAMLLAAFEMLGGEGEEALDYACALEMIHTYSLIHDDLPGMDDDDLRRGRPTNHKVYGVGQAILAGDGLLNMAYEVMLKNAQRHPDALMHHVRAMSEIARGAGVTGMVAGQCADLYFEGRPDAAGDMLSYIHHGKTVSLFSAAVCAGGSLAGASQGQLASLTRFAEAFGMLFQITDDILDVTADASLFGKSKGKDEKTEKLTAVRQFSLEGAKKRVGKLLTDAYDALSEFDEKADFFRTLARDMALRNY